MALQRRQEVKDAMEEITKLTQILMLQMAAKCLGPRSHLAIACVLCDPVTSGQL